MANLEMIVLLEPRSQSMEPVIATSHDRITPQDIAFCLARARKEASDVVRAKYLGNLAAAHNVVEHLYYWLREQQWTPPIGADREAFFRNFAESVLAEQISPHICQGCNGVARRIVDNKVIECSTCRGTGRKNASDNSRAHRLRISWSSYRWAWKKKYNEAMSYIDELEWEARKEIKRL